MKTPGKGAVKPERSQDVDQWIHSRQKAAGELWADIAVLRQAVENMAETSGSHESPRDHVWGNARTALPHVMRRIEKSAADLASKLDPLLIGLE